MERRYDVYEPPHALLVKVGSTPKAKMPDAIKRYLEGLPRAGDGLRVEPAMTAV
jgi:hypothetical protein